MTEKDWNGQILQENSIKRSEVKEDFTMKRVSERVGGAGFGGGGGYNKMTLSGGKRHVRNRFRQGFKEQ